MEAAMKKRLGFVVAFLLSICLAVPVSVDAAGSDTVYITETGAKYHRRSCSTLSRSKNLTALTIDQAIARGKGACKVCKPGGSSTSSSSTSGSAASYSAAAESAATAAVPAAVGTTPAAANSVAATASTTAIASAPASAITAEQAVQQAFALYVQNGLDTNSAMTHVQTVLAQLAAAPANYAQIVQNDLAALAAAAAGLTGLTAEQLVQQLYAQLIGQGFSSEQAMAQVNAQIPAILASAQ